MSTIGSRIRNRRIELGLSVDELALKLKKNRATVYRYESDDIENLPVSVIGPLAEALQVSPAYIMGWIKEETPAAGSGDERIKRFVELFEKLSPTEQDLMLAQMQGILAARE